jgi:hypothetical protein
VGSQLYLCINPLQAEAEEVCTILQQAFQLVYTEATMEHLNESIMAGERGSRLYRSSLMLAPKPRSPVHLTNSPPKPATPTEGMVSRQASTTAPGPSVPNIAEEEGKQSHIKGNYWCVHTGRIQLDTCTEVK